MAHGVAIFQRITTGGFPVAVWRLEPPLQGYSWAITGALAVAKDGKSINRGFALHPADKTGERALARFEPMICLEDNIYVPLFTCP